MSNSSHSHQYGGTRLGRSQRFHSKIARGGLYPIPLNRLEELLKEPATDRLQDPGDAQLDPENSRA